MFLLDTHTFYWFMTDDIRLSVRAKNIIETEYDVYVSVASFWEMAIKESIGKLQLPVSIEKLMEDSLEIEIKILSINGKHLAELKNLPSIHRDPFDRLLICQAKAEQFTLVSRDLNIGRYDVAVVW